MSAKIKDKHNNAHRANKISFQVMLTYDTQLLVKYVKESRGIKTNGDLLVKLLKEEKERIDSNQI